LYSHHVRSTIAAGIIFFVHIAGTINPSDILTKFLSWTKFWPLVQPFLFWKGETIKSTPDTLPLTELITELKHKPPSRLWGVSSINCISPSGSSNEPIPSASSPGSTTPFQEPQVISPSSPVPSTLSTGQYNHSSIGPPSKTKFLNGDMAMPPNGPPSITIGHEPMPLIALPTLIDYEAMPLIASPTLIGYEATPLIGSPTITEYISTGSPALIEDIHSASPAIDGYMSTGSSHMNVYNMYHEAVDSYTEAPWTVVMGKKPTC